jgi:hypothetical protein
MSVRSLDIFDLPTLFHNTDHVLSLDGGRFYTRGNPLGATTLLSYLNPTRHITTAVSSEGETSLIGQVTLARGETSARLTFLAPAENANGLSVPLFEYLVNQAGRWKAFHVLAEVDEDSPVFKALRQACFSVYAWQRIWKLPALQIIPGEDPWRETRSSDWAAVQSLHGQIVPALLQPVENLPGRPSGLVCQSGQGLQAYVHVTGGPLGVWLRPLVPPDSTYIPAHVSGLVRRVAGGSDRPIYMCVRSYQAWLEPILQDLGAQTGPRQAVMVRRLVGMVRDEESVPAMEKALAKVKPAAPLSRLKAKDSLEKE